jgi:hypothetical protein
MSFSTTLHTPTPTNSFLLGTLPSPSQGQNPRVVPDFRTTNPSHTNPYSVLEHTKVIATSIAGVARGTISNDAAEYSSSTNKVPPSMGVVLGIFFGFTGLITIAAAMLIIWRRRRGNREVKGMELGQLEGGEVKALDPPPPYERVSAGDGRGDGQAV